MTRRAFCGLAAVLSVGLGGQVVAAVPASGHAVTVSSTPRDGSALLSAPAQVSVTFDESVGLQPGYLQVIDGTGRRVDSGAAFHPDGHGAIVAVRLRPGLGNAGYLASYRVVSADSHPVSGVVRFTVGGAGPVTSVRGARTARTVETLMDGTRALSFLGLALLGGAWLLLLRRRPGDADDDAEPPEPGRGWTGVVAGAVLAAAALAVEFLLQGPYTAGSGLGRAIDPALLADTLSSPFGRRHLVAIGLIAGLGVAAARPRRAHRPGSPAEFGLAGAAWLVVLLAVAGAGHAGVQSPVWLGLPVTVLHLLAMTTWIGGLVVLATVVLPGAGTESGARWAGSVLPVFSRVAMGCVAALALTGTYQAWTEVGSWWALVHTAYGVLVLTKIALLVVLVGLGALARQRVAAWPGWDSDGAATASAGRLRAGVVAEILVAVVVLSVSGVLVAEPPGRNAAAAARPGTVTVQLSETRTATLSVTPPRRGFVTVEVRVSAGPVVQKVTLTATQPAQSIGPLPVPVAGDGTLYRAIRVDLPVAGDWQFMLTVQTSSFDSVTATLTLHLQ